MVPHFNFVSCRETFSNVWTKLKKFYSKLKKRYSKHLWVFGWISVLFAVAFGVDFKGFLAYNAGVVWGSGGKLYKIQDQCITYREEMDSVFSALNKSSPYAEKLKNLFERCDEISKKYKNATFLSRIYAEYWETDFQTLIDYTANDPGRFHHAIQLEIHNNKSLREDIIEASTRDKAYKIEADLDFKSMASVNFVKPGDPEEFIRILTDGGVKGIDVCQYALGCMYFMQLNQPEEGAYWLRRSAEQGNANSQHYLGALYYLGRGLIEDELEAVQWFRKAAYQGRTVSQYILGRYYSLSNRKDEAFYWFRRAADQNHAGSCFELAAIYLDLENLDDTRPIEWPGGNMTSAIKWLQRASDLGHSQSGSLLSTLKVISKIPPAEL